MLPVNIADKGRKLSIKDNLTQGEAAAHMSHGLPLNIIPTGNTPKGHLAK